MKSYSKIVAALFVASFLIITSFAAEGAPPIAAPSPTGTWKWTQQLRERTVEMTAYLEYKDGKPTGAMLGGQGPQGQIPDVPIADGSFSDGVVSFTATREFNGMKRTTKYEGKLEGDTIKGASERPNREGTLVKSDWVATRATK